MNMPRSILALALAFGLTAPVFAADQHAPLPPKQKWSFSGPFGKFDRAQLQRGFKVYREVCQSCHSLSLIAFRTLGDPGGPAFTLPQVRAIAADALRRLSARLRATPGIGDDGAHRRAVRDEVEAGVGEREILRARDEGLTRFAGITGHDMGAPAAFVEALRRYDLDTVMFPVNARLWADPAYRASAEELLALCAERDVGVMAIKAVARRPWGEGKRFATTWYEPFAERSDVEAGVRFALSVPGVHAFCTPGDLRLLPVALDAADDFVELSGAERARAVERLASLPLIFPMPA